ncbi:MAG: Cache 3/Cache 2 fusion domain-containing protein [Bacteroidota bacterium]|nr:Cache 3/Cache 2 fusion domain-containing protein [Bacteroidota bacterium]
MKRFSNKISIRLRKIIFEIGLIVIAIIITNVITIISARNTLQSIIMNDLSGTVETLTKLVDATRNMKLEQLNKDMNVACYLFDESKIKETNDKIEILAINQNTNSKYKTTINQWLYDGKQLQYNYEIVDKIKQLIGSKASIFQKIDSGFVRISTNVPDNKDERAVNTFIPLNSPIFKNINKGNDFHYYGRAFVVKEWYLTAYKSIVFDNKIKGLIYVGIKEKDLHEIKKAFNDLTLGKNIIPFCIDTKGKVLIHPDSEGVDWSNRDFVKNILSSKQGSFKYYDLYSKTHKIISFKFYPEYNFYVAASISEIHYMDKFRKNIINTSLICGILTLILIAVLIFFFTTTFNALHSSIKELAISNRELMSAKQALLQSEKLASMGQLAAGIAHELNNPLGVIIMYSHIAFEDCDENSPLKKDLELIAAQADRCKKIVAGLLNFARKNKVNFTKVNVRELIEKSISTIIIPSNVTIKIENKLTKLFTMLDFDQMVQVFTNLIKNAIDAMPNGGNIQILIENNAQEISFNIKDNGLGIPKENMDKLFEPFFTTKKNGKGTGLGLPIIYGIVKMHKGNIKVDSNTDISLGEVGTTFTVTIPYIDPENNNLNN